MTISHYCHGTPHAERIDRARGAYERAYGVGSWGKESAGVRIAWVHAVSSAPPPPPPRPVADAPTVSPSGVPRPYDSPVTPAELTDILTTADRHGWTYATPVRRLVGEVRRLASALDVERTNADQAVRAQSKLRERLMLASQGNADRNATIKDLEDKLTVARGTIHVQRAQLEAVRAERDTLGARVAVCERKREALASQVADLHEQGVRDQGRISELVKDLDRTEAMRKEAAVTLMGLRDAVNPFLDAITNGNHELAAHHWREVTFLSGRDGYKANLLDKAAAFDRTDLHDTISILRSRVNEVNADRDALSEERDALRDRLSVAARVATEREQGITERNARIKDLETQLAEARALTDGQTSLARALMAATVIETLGQLAKTRGPAIVTLENSVAHRIAAWLENGDPMNPTLAAQVRSGGWRLRWDPVPMCVGCGARCGDRHESAHCPRDTADPMGPRGIVTPEDCKKDPT